MPLLYANNSRCCALNTDVEPLKLVNAASSLKYLGSADSLISYKQRTSGKLGAGQLCRFVRRSFEVGGTTAIAGTLTGIENIRYEIFE